MRRRIQPGILDDYGMMSLTCIYHIETKLSFLSAQHSPVDMKSVNLSINPEYNKTLMGFLPPFQVP